MGAHMLFQYENVSYHNARPISSGPKLHQRCVLCRVSVEVPVGNGSYTNYTINNNSLTVTHKFTSAAAHADISASNQLMRTA